MFVIPISTTSAVSGKTYGYSDPIDLTRKWFDGKNLSLDVSIFSGGSRVFLNYAVCGQVSGSTYTPLTTGSGTSILAGTSTAGSFLTAYEGVGSDGKYFFPLTFVTVSGVTEWLRGIPFLKIGSRSTGTTTTIAANLVIG